MKIIAKRSLAWLMTLAMCVTLFCAVWTPAQAATVDYVYSGKYVKNWGVRDTVATFLSPMAEDFYEDNNTTYAELSALSGSSAIGSVPSSALFRTLQNLMKSNHDYQTSYNDTRNLFQYTDCQNSGKTSSKISSFYSGVLIGPAWDGGSTWNREHTWPNSKGLEGSDEDDIMMLRPTSKSENSSRGNTAYGESGSYYDPNGLGQKLRGDVARIMLYQYVRWGNTTKMWGTAGVMESKAVLLKWMEEDPVDTWELGRNDAVESITGTRNVFVDYPELAFVLFSAEIPADYDTPSGGASASEYTITASTNNAVFGTVSVSGKTINAYPAAGYEAIDYTILSGSATVTRSGNAFTVNATEDISIRINFAPRTQQTVRFCENGQTVDTQTVYSGDTITLPAHSGVSPEGLTFMGWVEQTLEETTEIPSYYVAGASYTVGTSVTLYALYSRFDGEGTGNSQVFEPYSGAITEGDYLLVSNGVAMIAESTDKNRLNYMAVTITDGNILAPEDKAVWHIGSNGSYWTMYNASQQSYAAATGVKSQAALLTTVNEYAKWSITYNDTGVFDIINKGNSDSGVNPKLLNNGSVGFACYATNYTSGKPISLYKRMDGMFYYSTGAEECAHVYDNDEDIDCNLCGFIRVVETVVRGDVSGDGVTNALDVAILQRHLNGWNVTVVEQAADISGDGRINAMDLALLQRLLVGWEI